MRTAEKKSTEQPIKDLEDQITGLQEQLAYNTRHLAIVRKEVANLQTLLDKGLVTAARVNGRQIERLSGNEAALLTQEAQARNHIRELELSRLGTQTLRDEVASSELAALELQVKSARARLGRITIIAPVSGRVAEMNAFTADGDTHGCFVNMGELTALSYLTQPIAALLIRTFIE